MQDFNFHKLANEISQIPNEEIEALSWEEKLNELLKFRQYYAEYRNSYSNEYLNFLEEVESEEDLEKKEDMVYFFKKETLTGDIGLDGLNFLFVSMMLKYNLTLKEYNDTINALKERYDVQFKYDWLKILSKENINLLESLSLLTYLQRSDYWDYEHMPLSYAIFDGTVDSILKGMETNLNEENYELLDIFVK